MTYNLSNLSRWDFIEFGINVNSQAHGWMGIMLLISIFFIIMLVLKNYESKRAFAAASFITTIVSIFLVWIGFVQLFFTIVLVIMTAGSALLLYFEDG